MFRAVVFACTLFLLGFGVGAKAFAGEDRVNIDPNKEIVVVTIGGVDFDIPLGYFFEKTVWTKGAWPKPSKERTVNRDMVIVAHLEGLKPWSRERDNDFKSGGGRTTRIWIRGNYNPNWLDNWIQSNKSLSIVEPAIKIPNLIPLASSPTDTDIAYVRDMHPQKPFFRIRCGNRPSTISCEVMFDFENRVVISYLIPVARVADWQGVHSEVVSLLNKLKVS